MKPYLDGLKICLQACACDPLMTYDGDEALIDDEIFKTEIFSSTAGNTIFSQNMKIFSKFKWLG